jgi:hypothetical protein
MKDAADRVQIDAPKMKFTKVIVFYPEGKFVSCIRGDTCKGCDRCIKCFQETLFVPDASSDDEDEPLLSSDDEDESDMFKYQCLP